MRAPARWLCGLALLAALGCSSTPDTRPHDAPIPGSGELSFAVISHTSIGIHRPGDPLFRDGSLQARTFEWLRRALHEPQSFPALELDSAAPDFLLVCGNLTDSGAVESTWRAVESALDGLGLAWYAVAGREDMYHAPVVEGFDKRFGGLVYSFDRGGAHFVALCSAWPLEPRAGFSPLQLRWLREDLAKNGDRNPVFLFVHHAPDSASLAPAQVLDLQAACDGHEVAALFFGEGRWLESRRTGALDGVQCGNMLRSASPGGSDSCGYVHACVRHGRLRVVFRPCDSALQPRLLLEKTLHFRRREPFEIVEPLPGSPAHGGRLELAVRSPAAPLSFQVDGQFQTLAWRREGPLWRASFPLFGVDGGAHHFAVGCDDDGTPRLATSTFVASSESVELRWRRSFAGSLRSSPVEAAGKLAIASTAGEVAVLDENTGELIWSAKTAAALGEPLVGDDGSAVVATTKGWVEAFDGKGTLRWRYQLGRPSYAGLCGDGELLFAADSDGVIHALEMATGMRRWKSASLRSGISVRPRLEDGRLVFCAGDNLERTLDARTGRLLGTVQCAGQEAGTSGSGRVLLSDQGCISMLDAPGGSPLWSWRASAQGAITATPLVRGDGTVIVAGWDGWLSAVRAR